MRATGLAPRRPAGVRPASSAYGAADASRDPNRPSRRGASGPLRPLSWSVVGSLRRPPARVNATPGPDLLRRQALGSPGAQAAGRHRRRLASRVRTAVRTARHPSGAPCCGPSRSPGSPALQIGIRRLRVHRQLELGLAVRRPRERPPQVMVALLARLDVQHQAEVPDPKARPHPGRPQLRAGLRIGIDLGQRAVEQVPELGLVTFGAAGRGAALRLSSASPDGTHARWSLFARCATCRALRPGRARPAQRNVDPRLTRFS